MLTWLKFGFIFYLFLASANGSLLWAANETKATSNSISTSNLNPEVLDIKGKLEDVIAKRYRERIATQIDPSAFTVSVQIFLNQKKLPAQLANGNIKPNSGLTPNSSPTPSAVPTVLPAAVETQLDITDFNLRNAPSELLVGHIQLESLILEYKQELAKLKAKELIQVLPPVVPQVVITPQNQPTFYEANNFSHYEITKVKIWVGLDKGFSAKYKSEFETWLAETITSEFGKNEEHKVYTIQKANPIEKPVVLTTWDRISDFQVLIGFAIIAAFLLFSTIAVKTLPSRDVKDQIKMAVQIEEMKGVQQQNNFADQQQSNKNTDKKNNKNQDSDGETNGSLTVMHLSYRDLQSKVAYLLSGNQVLFENIVTAWLEMDFDGRMKITSVIDALLYKHGQKDTEGDLLLPNRLSQDKNIHLALKRFAEMDFEERSFYLEEAYSELLSVRMLGDGALKSKFASLANLSSEKIQSVLTNQSPKVQALALLHLPEAKLKNYLDGLSPFEKKSLIEESVRIEQISEKELEVVDEALRFQIKKESTEQDMVQIRDLLPNLFGTLAIREEFDILREVAQKSPDQGLSIKRSYPSLVFVEEWPQDSAQILFSRIDLNTAQAFLQVAPGASSLVFSVLPKKTAQILRDDIAAGKKLTDLELDRNLLQLKLRLLKLVNDESISLEKIFRKSNATKEAA